MADHLPVGRSMQPISSLVLPEWNPRDVTNQDFEDLVRSIATDPMMMVSRPPLVADGPEHQAGRIVYGGNQRVRAVQYVYEHGFNGQPWVIPDDAAAEGWKPGLIPVDVRDIPQELAWQRALRDNNNSGTYDQRKVGELLQMIESSGGLVSALGFNEREIQASLAAVQAAHDGAGGAATEDVDPMDLPKTAISRLGDNWSMGQHRLVVGDCTDPEMLGYLMEGDKAGIIWTDPPYRVGYVGKTKDALTIAGDAIDGQVAESLLIPAFTAATPHVRPGSPFYITCPPGDVQTDFRMALRAVGWRLHEGLVWVKDVMVLGHSDYHLQHEDILYGWLPGPGRSGRGDHKGSRWYGDNSQTSTFAIARPTRSSEHPSMKPPALIVEHLKNSSRHGDIVLDLFAGSGSTMVAAEQLGRRAFMVEIDPQYADVVLDRYIRMSGQDAVRDDGASWIHLSGTEIAA